jgi:hypothetical protein
MDIKKLIKSYRISNSPQEIMQVMIKGFHEEKAILWQTFADHRVIRPVLGFEMNYQNQTIRVKYQSEGEFLDKTLPVYIKLPFRETVFKGQIKTAQYDQLTLDFPKEIHWRELRDEERIRFKLGDHFAFVKPHMPHLLPESLQTFKLYLRDITSKGIGLYVTADNDTFFKPQKFIDVVAFDEWPLMRPHTGIVVWRQRVQTKTELAEGLIWRLGVKMIDPFSSPNIEALCGGDKKRKEIAKALIESQDFGEDFKKQLEVGVKTSLAKMKQRPAIARYLKQLEISRSEDSYLSEHIEVLTVVCTMLARAMNWVSDASLEKFVYAAYLHDAPLFQTPRLVQIADAMEFDLVKTQMSQSEIDLFLLAPKEAARLAEDDPTAPPDVEGMLLMQKELPDGSGFPRGLKHTKITPMASLFIVAHALTDEIMKNPNWNVADWAERVRHKFRGGHFDKVMEAVQTLRISLKRD